MIGRQMKASVSHNYEIGESPTKEVVTNSQVLQESIMSFKDGMTSQPGAEGTTSSSEGLQDIEEVNLEPTNEASQVVADSLNKSNDAL